MEIIFEMNILLIIGLPLWIIIRGVILLFRRKKGDKLNLYKEIITNLFVIYLFILIGVTIFPLRIGSTIPYLSNMSILERYNINLIPFVDYYKNNISVKGVIRNVGGNLILLSPFIFYLCIKFEKLRSIKLCMLTSFLISLSIELIQLFMNILSLSYGRSVHTEDLILNTLGGIIAWYIFKYTYKGKFKDILNYDKENSGNNQ